MPQVRIDQKKVWIGDEPHALLSGEVHFWRLNPHSWRDVLRQVRELGLEIIASYICWEFHEISEGRFDFRGETQPQRNLVSFLDMVADEEFLMLVRPGPYIYGEWVNAGIPDRAAHYHRLHPEFQRAAATYIAAVVEVLKPYLATRGGPIIMLRQRTNPIPGRTSTKRSLAWVISPACFKTTFADSMVKSPP
jgi:beta-galactosidase